MSLGVRELTYTDSPSKWQALFGTCPSEGSVAARLPAAASELATPMGALFRLERDENARKSRTPTIMVRRGNTGFSGCQPDKTLSFLPMETYGARIACV